jgi:hypothetical protein
MREMVFDRHDLGLPEIETELQQAPLDALAVTVKTPVAGQDGVERTLGCIPVAFCIVPACRFGEADRGKGNGHRIDLGGLDAGKLQAELRSLVGHAVLGVLVANEALLLCRCDEFAVDVERRRRVVGQRAGQPE